MGTKVRRARGWILLTWIPVVAGAFLATVSDAARPFGLTLWILGVAYQLVIGLVGRGYRRPFYEERPLP
jgi:hypothetical protein